MSKLIIKNLSKTYANGTQALIDINLEIEKGMFGLLGPNGAGKSSLLRTLATLQEADCGSITLNGEDLIKNPQKIRKMLGYLPQEFGVYPRTTALQLLNHIAILKGVTNKKQRQELIAYLLDKVNLTKEKNKIVSKFSGGMKQRIGIAQALIGDPELIIVDEPTAGLDPTERNRFHNILGLIGEEKIVILSTHIVDDVNELCTNMAILNQGRMVFQGNPKDIINNFRGKIWKKIININELKSNKESYNVISEKMIAGKQEIHIISDTEPFNGFENVTPSLEDVFFATILSPT